MHHIYTTDAIIVKSLPRGEANRMYFLLTKDLGFIRAIAQGVRLGKSKLKGHLEELSLISLSVVKGKEFWRITSAEARSQFDLLALPDKRAVMQNILSLLLRLVHGEEKNEALFSCIVDFAAFLSQHDLHGDELKSLETLTVLRILSVLGYFKSSAAYLPFSGDTAISDASLAAFLPLRSAAIRDINDALKETSL